MSREHLYHTMVSVVSSAPAPLHSLVALCDPVGSTNYHGQRADIMHGHRDEFL